ncbi:MAG TPA: hypothetical protein DIU39_04610 [Flavobacteriales bacterium]|nr:hypothetical protein [Flavobacteriales bacterium]
METTEFLTPEQQEQVKQAIRQAELNTSGEIRVHIDKKCRGDNVLDRAAQIFDLLGMQKTELRNGVLIYVAVDDRQLAILGDVGVNQVVPDDFWESTRDIMLDYFKKGDYTQGLVKGILHAGEQLKKHGPYQTDDINELSDEITFG